MPFDSSAISGADLIKIRGDSSTASTYQNTVYVSIASNATIYSARVNQTSFPKPGISLTYDGGSGTLADVLVDMTILVSATNDATAAYFRGRIRTAPTSTKFLINETGQAFSNDDYIFVIDDFDTHFKLPRWGGEVLLDWDQKFSGLGPLISGHQAVYADHINSGTSVYEISFAPVVTAAQNGETISTYLWNVNDGTITTGTTATKDITVTFPVGERYVHLTATDSGGNTTTRHIKVFAHDTASNAPNPLGVSQIEMSCQIPLEINEGASEGWNASVTAFADVSALLDRSLVAIWNDEKYNGSAAHIVNNIAMVGRLKTESNTSVIQENMQLDATVSFEIEGVLTQLGRIASPSIQLSNSTDASSVVFNIDTLTPWRAIWAILSDFSTFGSVFPLTFDDLTDSFEIKGIVSQGGDLLSSVADIAQGITAVMQMAPDGRCEVTRRANMIATADRSSLVTIADMTTTDIRTSITLPRDYVKTISRIKSDGGGYTSATDEVTAYIAIAPPGAPEEPASEDDLPRQTLVANQSSAVDQAEMTQRVGDAFAAQNNLEAITVGLRDGWHFLIPSVDQRYTWTIPSTSNTRAITYTTAEDWMLQEMQKTPQIATGVYDITATFVRETDGDDGAIIPLPIVDTGLYDLISEFDEITELTPILFDDIDFDFGVDDGGFVNTPDETAAGTHSGGSGWQADCVGSAEWLDITKNLGGTKTVTSITIAYDATYAGGATLLNRLYYRTFAGAVWQEIDTGFTTSSGTGVGVTITVPEIVATDLRVILYAGGTDCTGSLTLTDFSYTVLEEAGAWSYFFDFTTGQQGFVPFDFGDGNGSRAVYVSGSGWEASSTAAIEHLIQVQYNSSFSSTMITSVTLSASVTPGDSYQFRAPDETGTQYTSTYPALTPTFTVNANCTDLWFSVDEEVLTPYTGYLTGVKIEGTGTNPFI